MNLKSGVGGKTDEHKLAQARSFAKLIDQDELEEFCRLRNVKGAAFGPGLATLLAPLKKRKDRVRVLRLWQKKSLSASDMRAGLPAAR